jgi:hypothetical protein
MFSERETVLNLCLLYTPHIHWVARGTGTPPDKGEVIRLLFICNRIDKTIK